MVVWRRRGLISNALYYCLRIYIGPLTPLETLDPGTQVSDVRLRCGHIGYPLEVWEAFISEFLLEQTFLLSYNRAQALKGTEEGYEHQSLGFRSHPTTIIRSHSEPIHLRLCLRSWGVSYNSLRSDKQIRCSSYLTYSKVLCAYDQCVWLLTTGLVNQTQVWLVGSSRAGRTVSGI